MRISDWSSDVCSSDLARALDALTLGEAAARSMGIDTVRLQWLVVLGVGLTVGASVAAAGVIGFVGLIVPHLVRPLVGHKPSAVLRSEERRVGKECVSTGRSRGSRYH